MASRWHTLTVDTVDPARLGRWWAEVLDYRIEYEDEDETRIAPVGTGWPGLVFKRAGEPKQAKNRLHIDLQPDDREGVVERLVNMGAHHVDVDLGEAVDPSGTLLADPEGNEFRVI
jgi:hypothetical protein